MVEYTSFVGSKFNEDGSFRTYPGLTIISRILNGSKLNSILKEYQDLFKENNILNKLTFLPHESFHMTVFTLMNDQKREKNIWSTKLKLDTPMKVVDDFVFENFNKIKRPSKIKMKVIKFDFTNCLGLNLEPYSSEQESILREYRVALAESLGLQSKLCSYVFHITFAYNIIKLNYDDMAFLNKIIDKLNQKILNELPIIELNAPELCFYNDMSFFSPEKIR